MNWFNRKRRGSTPPNGTPALVSRGDGKIDQADYVRRLEAQLQMSERDRSRIALELADKTRKVHDLNRELQAWRPDHEGVPLMTLMCKAFDRQQDAVLIAFTDGRLVYGNAAAETMFGRAISGQQVHHLFLDTLRAPFKLRLEDTQVGKKTPQPPGHELWNAVVDAGAGEDGGFIQDRVELRNGEGEALDVALTMQLLEDQSGQPCFVLIEALDIGALAKDELTKLFRREVAIRMMTREIAFNEKAGRAAASPFSVVFLDLDDFKSINSRYTDEGGDKVLTAVAKAMQKCIRSESKDVACRWGGDEFLAVVYGDEATSRLVAERMNEEIRRLEVPFEMAGRTVKIPVTASIGVASCTHGDTYEEIVSRAAHLKSSSKANGKGRVTHEMLPLDRNLIAFPPQGKKAT